MKTWDATPSSLSLGPLPNSRTSLRIQLIRAWSLLLLAVFSFSIPPILLAVGSYVYFQSSGRILPGVRAGELELGGKTIEEAMRVIDAEWNLENEIVVFDLDDPGRRWVDQASSFGLVVDAAATASRAFEQGREGRGLESIVRLLDVLHAGVVIENVVSIDAVKAKSRLEAWAAQVGIPPVEAQVALEGRTIVAQSAQDGKTVDVLASLNLLIEDPAAIRIEHQMLPLVTVPIPSRSIASQAAIETLEHMLQVDASLRVYDPVTDEHFAWSPGDAEFAEWIAIKPENGEFKVALRPDRMRAFVEGMTSSLGEQRAIDVDQAVATLMSSFAADAVGPLFVHYRPGSYVVRPGDTLISISFKVGMPYWKLNEVNPELARRGLVVGEELVVPPKDDLLSLPIIPEKRIVISILEQRMWVYQSGELIHEYVISTGIPNSPTMPGIFQISSHEENAYASIWDLYMPHFMGIYDAVPGLTNGIHGLPLLSNGRRLWADVLGRPASFGCIILDLPSAEQLFYWADEGVVVEIRG